MCQFITYVFKSYERSDYSCKGLGDFFSGKVFKFVHAQF